MIRRAFLRRLLPVLFLLLSVSRTASAQADRNAILIDLPMTLQLLGDEKAFRVSYANAPIPAFMWGVVQEARWQKGEPSWGTTAFTAAWNPARDGLYGLLLGADIGLWYRTDWNNLDADEKYLGPSVQFLARAHIPLTSWLMLGIHWGYDLLSAERERRGDDPDRRGWDLVGGIGLGVSF